MNPNDAAKAVLRSTKNTLDDAYDRIRHGRPPSNPSAQLARAVAAKAGNAAHKRTAAKYKPGSGSRRSFTDEVRSVAGGAPPSREYERQIAALRRSRTKPKA